MAELIGKGVYQFEEKTGVSNDPINVYYFRPKTWKAGDDIAFIMHGTNRDAERYLEDWTTYANEKNILVVCPEFSNEKYPGSRYYNTGNIMNSTNGNGNLQNKEDWVFPAINRIVDDVKTKFDSFNSKTLLYGHSAGAQIVHRYAIFDNDINFDLIISANAGWYTMPDDKIAFPYGVSGVPISNEEWRTIFSKPLVVLLGENDTVRDSNLRVTAEADAQGKNRFERGKTFYEKMSNKAKELGFKFNWNLSTVPGVGHSDYRMAKSAVEVFLSTDQTILTLNNSIKSPVTVSSAIKIINASKRTTAVKITGNSLANSIIGGSGNDTLNGAKGNDTLTGGKGKDVFISGTGKDVITDYATGDKISMTSAITKTSVSGSDVVFTMGKNSLTVKNAKGKSLSMINSSGKSYSTVVGGSTTLTVTNSTKSPVTVGSAIKTINASKRTTAVKITGNSLANTITGGSKNDSLYGAAGNDSILGNAGNDKIYGGKGNDTLTGGKGNDSLWGDAGKDTFIYANGDGKDVIYGFDNTDMLKITGKFTGTYNSSKKEVYFKVGSTSNAITLKNFSATTFNINSTNYKISGTKLVKK